ncbi:BAR1 [Candida pseudojiufengensis]|uniref:BAR1 n=1 Tax=Candida pseudojiufengensis TaxID=497109 RepID=UPI002224756F|nr:BAR1 [Candida pseudojiufengensis]KAI5965904.1 BAR1 [Candida pseudojiufengensis]
MKCFIRLLSIFIFSCLITKINCISFNFDIKSITPPESSLSKRQITTIFKNQKNVFLTNLGIGSNNDSVIVSIDTGSSDLWIMSNQVTCFNVSEFHTVNSPNIPKIFNDLDESYSCKSNGTFSYENSNTFKNENSDFVIAFADGSAAKGIWGNDSLIIGESNITVANVKFGIANQSSIDVGILGIGFKDDYDNLPILLQKQGFIENLQYSIYTTGKDSGIIDFDNIDDTKYENDLVTIEMDKNIGIYVSNSYTDDEEEQKNSKQELAIFDTGSTFSTLPKEWIKRIGESINGTYDENELAYEVNCNLLNSNNTAEQHFNFTLNDTVFSIPASNFIIQNERTNNKCYLGIMDESIIGGVIFGSDILKNFYLVYNLQDSTLSIAPIKDLSSEDQIYSSSSQNSEISSTTLSSLTTSSSIKITSSITSSKNGGSIIISGYLLTFVSTILLFFT